MGQGKKSEALLVVWYAIIPLFQSSPIRESGDYELKSDPVLLQVFRRLLRIPFEFHGTSLLCVYCPPVPLAPSEKIGK